MSILSVRYSDEDNTRIAVESTDGGWIQSWPSHTYRDAHVLDWLNSGGTISAYDPYYGFTLTQVKELKMREGEAYGRELVRQAHANPYDAVNIVHTGTYREKIQSKRRLRSDKRALSKPLAPEEELQLERDEVLQEYEVLCIEQSEEFNRLVDEAETAEEANALNPATDIVWPVWTPPA